MKLISASDVIEDPTHNPELDWLITCDDCLDGTHRRCRRVRKCPCAQCGWKTGRRDREVLSASALLPTPFNEDEGPRPKRPVRVVDRSSGLKCGRVSPDTNFNSVNDEVCQEAAKLKAGGAGKYMTMTAIAAQLNVDRSNLTRAMQRRGLH